MDRLLRFYMKLYEARPNENDFSNWEVFNTKRYKSGDDDIKSYFHINSTDYNYKYEKDICFIEKYFPHQDSSVFKGKTVLDLGCFTGGRLVRWVEKFNFDKGLGIDINPIFKIAGNEYLQKKKPPLIDKIEFHTGVGEKYHSMIIRLNSYFTLMY